MPYVVTLPEDRNRLCDPADPGGAFIEFGSTRQPVTDTLDGEYWQFADATPAGRTTTAVFNAETVLIPMTLVSLPHLDVATLRGPWRGKRLLLRTFEGDARYVSYLELGYRVNLRLTRWDVTVTFRVVT
jgi:hypothetical protein